MSCLSGKNILIGVTGGIAAYKSAELISRLVKDNANVKVIMTKAAQQFVTPLTLQTLSCNPVVTDSFAVPQNWEIQHIEHAKWANAIVIAPCTANVIGKLASGIADDALTTTVMASKAPVIIAPAMNCEMFSNPITQDNITKLSKFGYTFIEPTEGILACGDTGKGRLADTEEIIDSIIAKFHSKDFYGKRILVTAGATVEPIDAVRFISNRSTGKMGYAIACAAYRRGAEVTLITGRTTLSVPTGVSVIPVESARDMYNAVMANAEDADIIIKAAAVGDFYFEGNPMHKLKKDDADTLKLSLNPDILKEVGLKYGDKKIIVGFCMETDDLINNAYKKCKLKNCTFIVANNLNEAGAGFAYDTNIVYFVNKDGEHEELPIMSKDDVAHRILNKINTITSGHPSLNGIDLS